MNQAKKPKIVPLVELFSKSFDTGQPYEGCDSVIFQDEDEYMDYMRYELICEHYKPKPSRRWLSLRSILRVVRYPLGILCRIVNFLLAKGKQMDI